MRGPRWWPVAAVVATVALLLAGVSWVVAGGDDAGSLSAPAAGGRSGDEGGGSSGFRGDAPDARADEPVDKPPTKALPKFGLSIQSYEQVSPSRLQVSYAIGVPECYGRLASSTVEQSPQQVTITLLREPPPIPPRAACVDLALLKTTMVELDAPLSGRRVVDGATGTVLRVVRSP